MNIDKQNKAIRYNDNSHIYWLNDNENDRCVSVTTLIGKFHEKFDENFWGRYKAFEAIAPKEAFQMEKKVLLATHKWNDLILERYNIDKLSFNTKVNEIIDGYHIERDEACDRGTKFHLEQEQRFYKQELHEIPQYGLGGKFRCIPNYYELDCEKGVYPEYLIHKVSKDGLLKIAGQIDLLIKDGNDFYIVDYKGLPLDTPIATKDGWKLMGNLEVGDIVFDKDGNYTKIKNVSSIHNNPCYKIYFDNSESIICDQEHRWLIHFDHKFKKNEKFYDYSKDIEMTTLEIIDFMNTHKRESRFIPKIINAKPINTPNIYLPIDPYVFGCWLGDGNKVDGKITNLNPKLWEEIKLRGYEIGKDVSSKNHAETRTIFGLRSKLRQYDFLNNKYIPDSYLRASYNQRLDLLRGLMDTDGYYHPKRKRFVMGTTQEWQCYDLVKLLASLGIKSTVFEVIKTCTNSVSGKKKIKGWDVCFYCDFNPFLTRNEDINFECMKDNHSFRVIEKIERVETVETRCIEVDSPTHTYLAGYTMIPTHNTNKKIEQKGFFNQNTKSSKTMYYPLNNLEDCNYNHYTLQLSTYGWMIEQLNPDYKIKGLILIHYDHSGKITTYNLDYRKDDVIRMLAYHKKQNGIQLEKDKTNKIIF